MAGNNNCNYGSSVRRFFVETKASMEMALNSLRIRGTPNAWLFQFFFSFLFSFEHKEIDEKTADHRDSRGVGSSLCRRMSRRQIEERIAIQTRST